MGRGSGGGRRRKERESAEIEISAAGRLKVKREGKCYSKRRGNGDACECVCTPWRFNLLKEEGCKAQESLSAESSSELLAPACGSPGESKCLVGLV